MKNEFIYYVEAVDIDEKTEEDLKKEYEIHKIKYNENMTYEEFIRFKKGWKEDKFTISSFISSYHLSKEEALEYAKRNIGDINEAGAYPYAVVVTAPVGMTYYNSCQNKNEDFIILKYNREKDEYEELEEGEKKTPLYDALLSHSWGMISFSK